MVASRRCASAATSASACPRNCLPVLRWCAQPRLPDRPAPRVRLQARAGFAAFMFKRASRVNGGLLASRFINSIGGNDESFRNRLTVAGRFAFSDHWRIVLIPVFSALLAQASRFCGSVAVVSFAGGVDPRRWRYFFIHAADGGGCHGVRKTHQIGFENASNHDGSPAPIVPRRSVDGGRFPFVALLGMKTRHEPCGSPPRWAGLRCWGIRLRWPGDSRASRKCRGGNEYICVAEQVAEYAVGIFVNVLFAR